MVRAICHFGTGEGVLGLEVFYVALRRAENVAGLVDEPLAPCAGDDDTVVV